MRAPQTVDVDFETLPIGPRPREYPPKPVGVSIRWPGRKPRYYAWGHASDNNCQLEDGRNALQEAWDSERPLLFHHEKFDLDVAETHLGLGAPRGGTHDTMFALYLDDPHAKSLALKPSAERLLGLPPDERDAVKDWLVAHKIVAKNAKDWGAHIWEAPGNSVVGPYANGDVIRTRKLFEHLYPSLHARDMLGAYQVELDLVPVFLESERTGIRVDVERLAQDITVFRAAREKVEAWLRKRLQAPDVVFTNDEQVADALERAGVVTEFEPTSTGRRSMSKESLTKDVFSDPQVFRALGYVNRLNTALGTFMEPWLEKSQHDGRLHTTWHQTRQSGARGFSGTRTGRPSTSDPNFLNVPKDWYAKEDGYEHPRHLRVPELPNLRGYLLPERNQLWLHRDFNQQELRLAAHFEEDALCRAYNDAHPPKEMCDPKTGRLDIHMYVRSIIHQATGQLLDRPKVKNLNFGMLYGLGATGLAEKLHCTVDEARSLKRAQRKALPGIERLEDDIRALAAANLPIRTWGGREFYCEDPKYSDKYKRMQTFEYKLINYLVQGSAAEVTKRALLAYHRDPRREGTFLVTVYDEINTSSAKRAAKHEMLVLREAMETVTMNVPMLSDPKIGLSWGDLATYPEKR